MDEGLVRVGDANEGSRKKKKTVSTRTLAKLKRNSIPVGSRVFVPCKHLNKGMQCQLVRPRDAINVRNILYKIPDKNTQDNTVASWLSQRNIKRRRPRPNSVIAKPKGFSVVYSIISTTGKIIPVCRKLFMHITMLKETRLNNISTKVKQGKPVKDQRGGDRKSEKSRPKKESVRLFFSNLRGKESHYNRQKSKRIYLGSDLNIKKLWVIYNDSVLDDLKVKKSMFRRVFNEFNIGFSSPASDVCSTCNKIDLLLKIEKAKIEKDLAAINQLILEKRIHKLRANAFYGLLKENKEKEITFCFDLQQVQALPKTPIQDAFYKRQLSFYSFCIVQSNAKAPIFYTWTEDQAGRGATEVSSALMNFLKSTDFSNISKVNLFCDGCGGQNKNNFVVHTLVYYLGSAPNHLEEIVLNYPVRGHSFLPADRVFGRVEKLLRKKPTIATKEEYHSLYESVGEVRKLGEDWELINVKSLANRFKTIELISEQKRIFVKKEKMINRQRREITVIRVKATKNFRFESEYETYKKPQKKGWQCTRSFVTPIETLPLGHAVKKAKQKDVASLLVTMYGEDWEKHEFLSWYKTILQADVDIDENAADGEDEPCECLEPDIGLHI